MRLRALLLAGALLAGCYQVRFHRRIEAEPAPRLVKWHHSAVNGIFTMSDPVALDRVCPQGFAAARTSTSVWNALAQATVQLVFGAAITPPAGAQGGGGAAIVLQLWTPQTLEVWCATAAESAPAAQAVEHAPLARTVRFALLPLVARTGLSEDDARLFTDTLAAELRQVPGAVVVTRDDLAAALDVEQQRQLLGCDDGACLAELGGALGVDRVVHGSVGRIGRSLVVTLTAVDPAGTAPGSSLSERLRSDTNEAYFDALPAMVERLVAPQRDGAK